MILPKIDSDRFIAVVSREPLIAFQRLEYGYAVAAPGEAYYAPVTYPGGGNVDNSRNSLGGAFVERLGYAFLHRAGMPALRTLRPTAKPIAAGQIIQILDGTLPTFEEAFKKLPGDHPAVIEHATQVVIQTIEEHGRPDLQATMSTLKLELMSDALDLVIEHAQEARELCEVGGDSKPMQIRLQLMQSVQAMKTALEMMLKP